MQARPSPVGHKNAGFAAWVQKTFFSTWFDALLTIVLTYLMVKFALFFIQWGLVDAVWRPNAANLCTASAACWSVITTRWRLIFFGLYPADEQWRAALACVVIIVAVVMSCMPRFYSLKALFLIWAGGLLSFLILMSGGVLGLRPVESEQWSGLPLTLYVYAGVILLGMPTAVLIALGRRSNYPAIRWVLAVIVDTVRSLPLLAILFSFSLIIPFFLPSQMTFDKVYRVILGFTLFFACYQSEVIRGGMQSVSEDQEEAAKALGMKYFHRMKDIILPQALRNTMPMTINQFVMTFKDTSFIVIVGLFDLLATAKSAYGVPAWSTYDKEVYIFIAIIYFVFSYLMSEYGAYLERRRGYETR